jgi:release factor glutamine methyltransferase
MGSVRDTLHELTKVLGGRPQPHRDAQEILCHVLNLGRPELLINLNNPIDPDIEQKTKTIAAKVSRGRPLEYELGYAYFMGLKIKVNPFVLIPRPDTELIVEEASKLIRTGSKVLDLCTGSGCIALSLKKRNPFCQVTASDISQNALKVACENAQRIGVEVEFAKSDLFESIDGKFDIIVSNPPYIPTARIPTLQKEISYEPVQALDGGVDGLDFYRRINDGLDLHLSDDGTAVFEIDCPSEQEKNDLVEIFVKRVTNIIYDLSGLPRVLIVRKK